MSPACPDGFECMAGVCRALGATGACQAPGTVTLRQTDDDIVDRSLEFACSNADGTTAAASWYRVFPLDSAGFDVTSVGVGVCFAVGTPMISVKVSQYGGSATDPQLDLTNVVPLGTANAAVEATQISKLIDVPVGATLQGSSNLLVEVSLPDLDGTGESIAIGVTAGDEAKPGYLKAPLCGTANAVTTTGAGVPEAHLVITVTGTR
jgi:hypothetical protein